MSKISRRNFLKSAVALSSMPLLVTAQENKKKTLKFIHVTDSHMDLGDNDSAGNKSHSHTRLCTST